MNHAQIVATYSDNALTGIIQQLTISRNWPERLEAARNELKQRKNLNK
jgi:hypothetical protein